MCLYLYDLCECVRGGLGQQGQAQRAVQLSDGGSHGEGERRERRAGRRRIFGHTQELTRAVQEGGQHLESTRTHL